MQVERLLLLLPCHLMMVLSTGFHALCCDAGQQARIACVGRSPAAVLPAVVMADAIVPCR